MACLFQSWRRRSSSRPIDVAGNRGGWGMPEFAENAAGDWTTRNRRTVYLGAGSLIGRRKSLSPAGLFRSGDGMSAGLEVRYVVLRGQLRLESMVPHPRCIILL
jgi:hypothetical protein